eukprot:1161378-Pelagomonas_calceolata.AAC.2
MPAQLGCILSYVAMRMGCVNLPPCQTACLPNWAARLRCACRGNSTHPQKIGACAFRSAVTAPWRLTPRGPQGMRDIKTFKAFCFFYAAPVTVGMLCGLASMLAA